MKGRDDKPGLDLLPERRRMSYGEDLKKKLSSTIRGNKEVQSRDKFTKREVKALMTRHLLGLAVDLRKSEFDILVTLKVICIFLNKYHLSNKTIQDSATVLQMEVKTYPQGIEKLHSDGLR